MVFEPSRILLQNRANLEFSVVDARDNFALDPKFSGGHKIHPSGARDLIFFEMRQMDRTIDSKAYSAEFMTKDMPKKILKLMEILRIFF